MDNPLISVIVPIYKVENYLHRCVDSILNQTYTNLEIILVDDGSPDNCGRICDEYAEKDSRVVVIHRENGGLSAARNSGLDICKGDYIGFVDSDDCIHPEMYQLLYEDIKHYGTKLAFCQPNMCKNQNINAIEVFYNSKCYDAYSILNRCMIENIWWSACTKIYSHSLFDNIRFPEGKTNEDYPVTIRIYDKCDRIAVNYNKLYNYCLRQGSIARSKFNVKKFDQIDTANDVYGYMQEHHSELASPAQRRMLASCIGLLMSIVDAETEEFGEKKQMIYRIIKSNFYTGIRNNYLTKAQKLFLAAAYLHPSAFELLYRLTKNHFR